MKTILKHAIFFTVAVACAIAGGFGAFQAVGWTQRKAINYYEQALSRLVEVKVIREAVPAESLPLEVIYRKAAEKYGLPPVALKALAMQESSGGKYLYRFEPHVFARLKGEENERRMMASSHGVMQILGTTAKEACGLHWSELYDRLQNVMCGARYLRMQLDRHKTGDKAERMLKAFASYNGSGEKAELHAQRVMAWVGRLMFEDVE